MKSSTQQSSSDERLLAALAQVGIFLPGFGFLVPLHIWLNHRDWSRCVARHALQALVWHLGSSLVIAVYVVVVYLGGFGTLAARYGGEPLPPGLLGLRCGLFLTGAGFYGLLVFVALRAVRRILAGYDHIYPLVGSLLGRYL